MVGIECARPQGRKSTMEYMYGRLGSTVYFPYQDIQDSSMCRGRGLYKLQFCFATILCAEDSGEVNT